MKLLSWRSWTLLPPVLAAIATPALAEGPDAPAAADNSQAAALEEIVVTAQKREQAINDVGMSISAFSGSTLTELGVNSTADLSKVVAGLQVQPPGANIAGAPVYTLRGVGFNEKSLAALSAVSFYSDEIPLPYVYMTAGPTVDIRQVEVLKGPQGTLYGQNSTAGTINYIANKPTDTLEAGIEGSYSRFDTTDVSAYASGPLLDTLTARVAFRDITADGWQESASRPGDKLGLVNTYSGRVLLDWKPSEQLKFELNLNGWKDGSESQGVQILGYNPAVYDAAPFLVSPGFFPNYAAEFNPKVLNPNNARLTDWNPGVDYRNDNEFGQVALRAEWQIIDAVKLTSITADSYFRYATFHDVDATPIDINSYAANGWIHAFSQELRLSGDAWNRFNWVGGANYSHDSINDNSLANFGGSTLGFFAVPGQITTGGVSLANSDRTSRALFANGDLALNDAFSVNAGVRYTKVALDFNGCAADDGNGAISVLVTGTTAFTGKCVTYLLLTDPGSVGLVRETLPEHNISWHGGVNWKFGSDDLLYATISRGFKSGNIPNVTGTLETQYAPVKQEEVTSEELGIKTNFLDHTLQLNAAIYHMKYLDKQLYAFVYLPVIGSASEQTVNIPNSKVNGAELEIQWQPLQGLRIRGNVSYVDTRIVTGPANVYVGNASSVWPPAAGFVSQAPGDLTGQPFNLAPKWQGNLDGEYMWHLVGNLDAFFGATGVSSSSTLETVGASSNQNLPAYTTLDLRSGVASEDGKWRVSVWGRNVTNRLYLTGIGRGFDETFRFTAMPATYGVTASYAFK